MKITKGDWHFQYRPRPVQTGNGAKFHTLYGTISAYDNGAYIGEVCQLQSEEHILTSTAGIPKSKTFYNGMAIQSLPEILNIIYTLADTGGWETSKLESLIFKAKMIKNELESAKYIDNNGLDVL